MFTHYCVLAFKNIWKYRVSAAISILGLAFALTCLVPILYWVRYETHYDTRYPDASSIYRIYSVEPAAGKTNRAASRAIENALKPLPAIEASTLVMISQEKCRTEEVPYVHLNTLYTDSTFFAIFPQDFLCGESQPLAVVHNMVLSESLATRLFGSPEAAIGQKVQTLMNPRFPAYHVTAVVKDPPADTNLPFDAIIYHDMLLNFTERIPNEAQWNFFMTDLYVKLAPHTDPAAFAESIRTLPEQVGVNPALELRTLPIADVRHHLNADVPFTLNFIGLFVFSGALLLLAAVFNFLNTYFDLFRQRVREWRLRAVNGARRGQLVAQMLTELGCSLLVSLVLALTFVYQVRPLFAQWIRIEIAPEGLLALFALVGAAVFVAMEGIGLLYFARLSHLATTSPTHDAAPRPLLLRRVAIGSQLVISLLFIVAAVVVMEQMRFVGKKDLGFDREGIVQVSDFLDMSGSLEERMIQELKTIPQVKNATDGSFKPAFNPDPMMVFTDVSWEGKPEGMEVGFCMFGTDHRFAETLGLRMLDGQWFPEAIGDYVVINETAARLMGLDHPVGSVIRMPSLENFSEIKEYTITGVVNDFHAWSFREPMRPMAFLPAGGYVNNLYFRVEPASEAPALIQRLYERFPELDPTLSDVRLTPIGELYDELNQSELVGLRVFSFLAMACLLISLFGLYAVATASTKRRRKEIAIRKVVGAEASSIVGLFLKEYGRLVVGAAVIAFPVAYVLMERWLQGYAYRVEIAFWWLLLIFAGIAALVLLTIGRQVLRAANENPAEVVKSE